MSEFQCENAGEEVQLALISHNQRIKCCIHIYPSILLDSPHSGYTETLCAWSNNESQYKQVTQY